MREVNAPPYISTHFAIAQVLQAFLGNKFTSKSLYLMLGIADFKLWDPVATSLKPVLGLKQEKASTYDLFLENEIQHLKKKSNFLFNNNQLVPKVIYVHLQLVLCFIYIYFIYIHTHTWLFGVSRLVLVKKNPPDNTGDIKDMGLILQWSRSSGGGHGNPLQYSCLENSMDRKAWWVTVHGVSRSHKETEMT